MSLLCQKILNAEQIRQADQFTIKNEPIASIDLMERASEAFVEKFSDLFDKASPVLVFCGTGNNGGDGLAISRLLLEQGHQVSTFIIGNPQNGSEDFKTNAQILKVFSEARVIHTSEDFPHISPDDILIDAIFGSGLARPVSGLFGELVEHINNSASTFRVAVDIASGLACDTMLTGGEITRVSHTITFQVPKLSQLLPANEPYVGQLYVVNIGLDEDFIQTLGGSQYMVTETHVKSLLKKRSKFFHKGDAGRGLIAAGAKGKIGAAILSGKAYLRAGGGLLTLHIPQCGTLAIHSALPEAMVMESSHEDLICVDFDLNDFDVVAIGPGIGMEKSAQESLLHVVNQSNKPLVVDADGLNIMASHPSMTKSLPSGSVLTPHPGEFKRIVGNWKDDYHRLELLTKLANDTGSVVLLKGAYTTIASPDGDVYFNPTGNPGMATAGSGDVLTGIIASFLGQGLGGLDAAILGAYIHGLAGDIYMRRGSAYSLVASDLIDCLPQAFRQIQLGGKT